MKVSEKVLALLLGVLLAISAAGIAFAVVLSKPVVHMFAEKYSTAAGALGRTHEDLVEVAEEMRAFVVGSPDSGLPVGDDYRIAFDAQEMAHMEAVRTVFHTWLVIAAVAIAAAGILWMLCWWKGLRDATSYGLAVGGVLPVAFLVIVGGAALVNFNAVFEEAHVLLFNNLNWLFPEDSLMILTTPPLFWEGESVLFCIVLLVIAIAFCVVGHILHNGGKRKGRRSNAAPQRPSPLEP